MFDIRQVGRLLREDWKNPTDLARELHAMLTNGGPKKVDGPVEIAVPKGQPGLRLTRSAAQPARVTSRTSTTTARAQTSTPPPDVPSPRPEPTSLSFGDPVKLSPSGEVVSVESTRGVEPIAVASHFDATTSGQAVPRRTASAATEATRYDPSPKGQIAPQTASTRGDTPEQLASFARPYQSPQFETDDDVRFSGIKPVQFDRPPYVFNPTTEQYEPLKIDRSFQELPGETRVPFWWGTVVSGTGATYQVEIRAYPGADLEATVQVTIPFISPYATLPVGTPLFPVHEADDDNYYAQPPIFLGSLDNGQ